MNKEIIKSLTLTLLVFTSLLLTWGLWTYQPLYEPMRNSNYIQNVEIGQKKEMADVIFPKKVLLHRDGNHYGAEYGMFANSLFENLRKWSFFDIHDVSEEANKDFQSFIHPDNSVELVFPLPIPAEVVSNLLEIEEGEYEYLSFDRMIIKINDDIKTPEVLFVSTNEKKAFAAKGKPYQLSRFKKTYYVLNDNYQKYFTYTAENGKELFLLDEAKEIPRVTYSVQYLDTVDFKNALFKDPSLVKQYSPSEGEEYYTDGARAIEVFYSNSKLRYINPTRSTSNLMNEEQLVYQSVGFINSHAGWTDEYYLFNLNTLNQSLTFRLFVDGYPVFDLMDNYDISTIYQSWRQNEIYEYIRSLTNLRFEIEGNRVKEKLISARQVVERIEKELDGFNSNLLQDISLGYRIEKQHPHAVVLTFTPKWFYKYRGKWQEVPFDSRHFDQGGNGNGLE